MKAAKSLCAFVCFLAFITASCSSPPSAGEPTLTLDVIAKPSTTPEKIGSTPVNLVKEPTKQLQPTAQTLQGPVIAPTVDVNTIDINLKQELYFDWGAEQGDGFSSDDSNLPTCTHWLFEKYGVSSRSISEFFVNGVIPAELKSERVPPFFQQQVGVNDNLHLCIYGFPEDEIVTVELHAPGNSLCVTREVHVSEYYYLAIGHVTVVDLLIGSPWCSYAGKYSLTVKSASAYITEPIEIRWDQTAKFSVSCASNDFSGVYESVTGAGYPPGETRLLGVYGTCSAPGEGPGGAIACDLLAAYMISIDDSGRFEVLLPLDLSELGAEYIVVPQIEDYPPAYGGHTDLYLNPGVVRYYSTDCDSIRDLYLATPTLNGEDVGRIQQRLRELGHFEVGPADGHFGLKTDAAVRLFQQTNALDANGIVDETTRKAIFDENAIARPHERNLYVTSPRLNGDDVVIVQQRLTDLGYREVGEVDGYYGPLTESGVLRFQKMNKLPESGIVDEQTWNMIFGSNPVPGW